MPALKGARRSLQKGHHRAPDLNLGPHVVRWRDRRDRSSRRDVRAEGEIRAESVLAAPPCYKCVKARVLAASESWDSAALASSAPGLKIPVSLGSIAQPGARRGRARPKPVADHMRRFNSARGVRSLGDGAAASPSAARG